MNNKELHIVSFDIPLPANYGGVIDVFYRIKALHKAGINIVLHAFFKDRDSSDELEKYCSKVFYYKRKMSPTLLFKRQPFIVLSRSNYELFSNLKNVDAPILFEGLHTTFFLEKLVNAGKRCFVRTHNIEHEYYDELSKADRSFLKSKFFQVEAKKLKQYDKVLSKATGVISISEKDDRRFREINQNSRIIIPFHPEPELPKVIESGNFGLYHGNLEVAENKKAAIFLIELFNELQKNLIIAGKGAFELRNEVSKSNYVEFIDSPSDNQLAHLAFTSKVHVLPTFQATGFKLKFLFSLYTAQEIIASPEMVKGTPFEKDVIVADGLAEWKEKIKISFENSEHTSLEERRIKLDKEYSNKSLAAQLIQFLQ